jgi:hypothetical protein
MELAESALRQSLYVPASLMVSAEQPRQSAGISNACMRETFWPAAWSLVTQRGNKGARDHDIRDGMRGARIPFLREVTNPAKLEKFWSRWCRTRGQKCDLRMKN